MFSVIRQLILLNLALLIFSPIQTLAVVQFELTEDTRLKITSQNADEFQFVPEGSISRRISLDGQVFRVSYGVDIKSRTKIILYADTSSPQAFQIQFLGKQIHLSPDAVLTITVNPFDKSATFTPGVIGRVKVDGQPLDNQPLQILQEPKAQKKSAEELRQEIERLGLMNHSKPIQPTPPIETPQPQQPQTPETTSTTITPSQAPARISLPKTTPPTNELSHEGLDVIQEPEPIRLTPAPTPIQSLNIPSLLRKKHPNTPPTVAITHGGVSVAPQGSSTFSPISEGQTVPIGSILRTDKSGVAYLIFSEYSGLRLSQDSEIIIHEAGKDNIAKAVDILISLKKGSVVTSHQPPDPNLTSIRIVLNDSLAAANQGTFSIFRDKEMIEISVIKGGITLTNGTNTQVISSNQWSQSSPSILNPPNSLPEESRDQLIGLLEVLNSTIQYASES